MPPKPPGKAREYDWGKLVDAAVSTALRVLGQALLYWLTGRNGHL